MAAPSPPDRTSALRTVVFAVLAALVLAILLATAYVSTRREEQDARWGELYRRGGDAYVSLAYLAVGAGLNQQVVKSLLEGAQAYYLLSSDADRQDPRALLSRALVEGLRPEGRPRARALLLGALAKEWRAPERAQFRAALLVVSAEKPDPRQLAAAERALLPLAPGPWALSDAYQAAGESAPAGRLWDTGWKRATRVVPRVVVMLVVCGLILLAGAVGLVALFVSGLRRGRAEGRVRPPAAAWDLRAALEALLLYIVLQFVVGALVVSAPRAAEPYLFLLPAMLAGVGAIAWVWFVSPPGRQLGWRLDHPWRRVLVGVAAAGVIVLPAARLGELVRTLVKLHPEEHPLVPLLATASGRPATLFLILGACVIIPVLEETLFRGVLYGALRRRLPVGPAMLSSAAVFAAGHLSAEGFVPYLVVGVMLAWLYERSGSLLASTAAHGAFNAFNIAMLMMLFR